MAKRLRLCVGASSGGHMVELQSLLEQRGHWPVEPSLQIVTLAALAAPGAEQLRTLEIGECNRNTPLSALRVLIRSLIIAARERPHVVVSTGSLPLALFCISARLFGARIIWIDSVSQIDRISLSGRLVRRFACLFLVQWPALAESHSTRYEGELV